MKVVEVLAERRPVFSFEFFPPTSDKGVENLVETIRQLRELDPAFVSVTYGAGGSTRSRSLDVVKRIRADLKLNVMAHVTCVGSTEAELRSLFDELRDCEIENVLALRGDPPQGSDTFTATPGGFAYASELTAMLTREYDFCIGGAAYPEKHPEAKNLYHDMQALRRKVDAGAQFLVTQLFFDNDHYFTFVDRAREAGITVPIIPGIMPITNFEQIARFTARCGAAIPQRLRAELEARAGDLQAVIDLGVAYAALQSADLLKRGAPGIHFYTLNKSPATRAVVSALIAARTFKELSPGEIALARDTFRSIAAAIR